MEAILMSIMKKQNLMLIRKISEKYGKDEKEMIRKYHTPTFYKPEVSIMK
jgi:hypothetical protein